MKNKLKIWAGAFTFVFILAGCKTTQVEIPEQTEPEKIVKEYKISRSENNMFWEVSRTDKTSKVYVLGTYHYGDERLPSLNDDITTKFLNADNLASELGTYEDNYFQEQYEKVLQNSLIADDSRNIIDSLSDEELMYLLSEISMEQIASRAYYNPWVLNDLLTQELYTRAQMDFSKSYDNYLSDLAENIIHKKVDAMDDIYEHLSLANYGTWDFQLEQLKETIDKFNDINKAISEIQVLYEAYLYCDEQTIVDLSGLNQLPRTEEERIYVETVNTNRNKEWASKIEDYLDKGGTTFIFAGVGHFVGPNNVFEYLKQSILKETD